MGNGLERRKLRRLDHLLDIAVEIVELREKSKALPSVRLKSRNISMGGICLEANSLDIRGFNLLSGHPGSREYRVHLRIEFHPEEPLFEAIGELCWYDVARNTPQLTYHIGIEFLDIKGNGRKQLKQFLTRRDACSFMVKLRNIAAVLGKLVKR